MLRILFCLIATYSAFAFSQQEKSGPPAIATQSATKIIYGSSQWNLDSKTPDSAFIFIRDRETGKIAKIVLDETAPDSSTFSGSFSLGWGDLEKTKPEIYIPPQNLRGTSGLEKFKTMLTKGQLSRKPVVFRKDDSGKRVLDVFDTKDQAKRAWESFKQSERLNEQQKQAEDLLKKAETDEATLAAAKMAEKQKMLKTMELEATKREADRIRMEQLERQKAEENRKKQDKLAAAERRKNKLKAEKLAQQALAHYKKAEFKSALPLFKEAVDLDPENHELALKYGITQYRLEKFNEALVTLKIIPDEKEIVLEKSYYMGLIHFRLRELPQALEKFRYVKQSTHPLMGPSSTFYEGMILFGQEKWDESQAAFEKVLDTSKDPKMDNKAEEYIEKIAGLKAWEQRKKKPFTLVAMVGTQYDSNVLLSPDGVASQGTAIEPDARGVLMGQLQYRALYEKKHEWTPTFLSYYQRSSKDAVSSADVFLNNVSLPYSMKTVAWGKGLKFTIKPAYEIINMDINEDGTREVILSTPLLNLDSTFVMNKKWFASYIFETRADDSQLSTSTGDDDRDAMRYTLKTKHLNFLDDKRKKILQTYFGIVYNDAKGKNQNYNRIELGSTFMKPLHWWKSTWSLGLAVYQLKYPDADTKRNDFNTTLSTGISRPVYEWLNFGVTVTYVNNSSDVSANQYNKYTIMTSFTSNYTF